MKKYQSFLWLVLFFLFAAVPAALAKGTPDKISISGAGLAAPVEITPPSIPDGFNPWMHEYLDKDRGVLKEPPKLDRVYEVNFYFKDGQNSDEFRMFYALQYAYDPAEDQGYIYLPGKESQFYTMNTRTIALGWDGKWSHASMRWDAWMRQVLNLSPAEGSAASQTGSSVNANEGLTASQTGSSVNANEGLTASQSESSVNADEGLNVSQSDSKVSDVTKSIRDRWGLGLAILVIGVGSVLFWRRRQ